MVHGSKDTGLKGGKRQDRVIKDSRFKGIQDLREARSYHRAADLRFTYLRLNFRLPTAYCPLPLPTAYRPLSTLNLS